MKWRKHRKHSEEFDQEYSKTAHNMTLESKILAVLSCLSFLASAIDLIVMAFGFASEQLLIVFALMAVLFIMSSMRMIKVIANHEQNSNKSWP